MWVVASNTRRGLPKAVRSVPEHLGVARNHPARRVEGRLVDGTGQDRVHLPGHRQFDRSLDGTRGETSGSGVVEGGGADPRIELGRRRIPDPDGRPLGSYEKGLEHGSALAQRS